jgi:hypothetical protein
MHGAIPPLPIDMVLGYKKKKSKGTTSPLLLPINHEAHFCLLVFVGILQPFSDAIKLFTSCPQVLNFETFCYDSFHIVKCLSPPPPPPPSIGISARVGCPMAKPSPFYSTFP